MDVTRLKYTCLLALAACAALFFNPWSLAAGEVYYRWLDERGNPVNSDRPPPAGTPYEVVSTQSTLVRHVDATEGAVPPETEPSVSNQFEPVQTKPQGLEKNPEQCKRARENLETLNTKVRIQIRNEQGELRPLTEEEKEEQRKIAQDTISVHCD